MTPFAQAVLDNVDEDIREQVAYALELAAASVPTPEQSGFEMLFEQQEKIAELELHRNQLMRELARPAGEQSKGNFRG